MLELAGVVILGILAQWIAWKTGVPAILPLIITGLLVGPAAEYYYGFKLIDPLYDSQTGRGLFAGHGLFFFVELSIAVILFEGGLTLRKREISKVGPVIIRLITVGSIVTFFGAGLSAHFILGLSWPISFLFGGLVIVTGPTVIAPILRNIPLNKNISTVLKWEGILIDPIGAIVAVLVYEFILASLEGHRAQYTREVFLNFAGIVFSGLVIGVGFAYAFFYLLKKELVPQYLLNAFTLAMVLLAFVLSNSVANDAGLLTVVLMGMTIANLKIPHYKDILFFKESISVLLISILFILLSANIDLAQLHLLNWPMLIVFAIIVFLLRPLGVFLSTFGESLNLREKIFISWIGPRGIVAAGIASLFGIRLVELNVEGGNVLTPLVFLIVLGTVFLTATTGRPLAKFLKVIQDSSDGVLMVGASKGPRLLAKYLHDNGIHVVIIDRSESSVAKALEAGLEAIQADMFSDNLKDRLELLDMGFIMAMTSSDEINKKACENYQETLGENGTFRLASQEEIVSGESEFKEIILFSIKDDFLNFSEVVRDFPEIHEVDIVEPKDCHLLLGQLTEKKDSVPVFYKDLNKNIRILNANYELLDPKSVSSLIYVGKAIDPA